MREVGGKRILRVGLGLTGDLTGWAFQLLDASGREGRSWWWWRQHGPVVHSMSDLCDPCDLCG
jgi:hypothetical protein